jgi:hypothetical protein
MVTSCTTMFTFQKLRSAQIIRLLLFVWISEPAALVSIHRINGGFWNPDGLCLLRGTNKMLKNKYPTNATFSSSRCSYHNGTCEWLPHVTQLPTLRNHFRWRRCRFSYLLVLITMRTTCCTHATLVYFAVSPNFYLPFSTWQVISPQAGTFATLKKDSALSSKSPYLYIKLHGVITHDAAMFALSH